MMLIGGTTETRKMRKMRKMRKCEFCKKPFAKKASSFETWCSPDCGYGVACARLAKAETKRQAAERKADREKREKLKTRSDYIREAQAVMNRYVRLRDAGEGCISCGVMPEQKRGGSMDCGHYLSRGSSPHLRFHLWNMAAQCVKENRYLGGAAGNFRLGLIKRIGVEKVEALEAMQGPAKFTVDYLKRLKSVFAKKAARQEKRNALQRG